MKAVQQSQHVLEMDPAFTGAYLMLAEGYVLQHKWDEALAAYAKISNFPQAVAAGVAYIG